MGSRFPAHPPPSSDLPSNQVCFNSLFMRFNKACSMRKIDAAASAHLDVKTICAYATGCMLHVAVVVDIDYAFIKILTHLYTASAALY